jgi:hypothetical protein
MPYEVLEKQIVDETKRDHPRTVAFLVGDAEG